MSDHSAGDQGNIIQIQQVLSDNYIFANTSANTSDCAIYSFPKFIPSQGCLDKPRLIGMLPIKMTIKVTKPASIKIQILCFNKYS